MLWLTLFLCPICCLVQENYCWKTWCWRAFKFCQQSQKQNCFDWLMKIRWSENKSLALQRKFETHQNNEWWTENKSISVFSVCSCFVGIYKKRKIQFYKLYLMFREIKQLNFFFTALLLKNYSDKSDYFAFFFFSGVCVTNQQWTVLLAPPPSTISSSLYQPWSGTKICPIIKFGTGSVGSIPV